MFRDGRYGAGRSPGGIRPPGPPAGGFHGTPSPRRGRSARSSTEALTGIGTYDTGEPGQIESCDEELEAAPLGCP